MYTQSKKLFTDWLVCFYTRCNKWQIFWQDQIFTGKGTETYKNQIYNIIRSYDKKTTPILFMNNLQSTKKIFDNFEECGQKDHVYIGRHAIWGRTKVDKITAECRNLDTFCPDAVSQQMEKSNSPIVDAVNFLMTLSSVPSEIRYSLGYMIKKSVVTGIEDVIKEKYDTKKSSWISSIDVYNDLCCGCKSGVLWSKNFDTLNHNITQYDKSSAYSSVMVNDNKFPVGKITYVSGMPAIRSLESLLKRDQWLKIVFDEDADLPMAFDCFRDVDDNRVAMEYWDIKDCPYDLVEICKKNIKKIKVYHSSETDYLCREYRDKIVEIYTEKQQLSKGDFYRDYAKAKLELLYGKGIQKKTFINDRAMRSHFYKPENYINPAMAMHCSAAVRYELRRALMENNLTYCDTDSIHGVDSKQFRDNVKKYNEEIMEKNARAGYPELKIGVFELEYANSDELVLNKKQRVVFTKDGETVLSIAGVPRQYVERDIKGLSKDQIIQHFITGGLYRTIIRLWDFDENGYFYITRPFSTLDESRKNPLN